MNPPAAPAASPAATLDRISQRLARVHQQHLLSFYPRLTPAQQTALVAQIDALDLESLPALIDAYVLRKPEYKLPSTLAPARCYPLSGQGWDRDAARRAGEDLIRKNKVAAFVVAGGQGSRLGFDGPKGCYPAGAVTNKPLFQIFAEGIKATQRTYACVVPWYIMTSPLNHEQTVSFFRRHNTFGLDPANVKFFQQGVMPSFDMATGKVLLSAPHEVATNPDGHGGAVRALHQSGSLADMRARGVEHLSYFQVDNPHVRVIDPVFIGLHATAPDSSGEMSSKMVAKASPDEKVGVFVQGDGRTQVLEYSDMPKALQEQRDASGALTYNAGSIAIHIISVEFLSRLATDPKFALPAHRAEKKIPHADPASGQVVSPTTNNGVKLEKFIFDALPLCKSSIVLETDRVEEFAPIKNATGVDSIDSSRALQTRRASRWLEAAGVRVPQAPDASPDCVLEVSPLTALDADQLKASPARPASVAPGARLAI
jgi:UDP-N-acetylglucosamine/UDP-N-acetylgalactosamine diphosphorylase